MHGQAQHHESNDLTEARKCRMETFDLSFERGALVAQDNAGNKDCKEAGAVCDGGRAVENQCTRQCPQGVQPFAW